jgi:hypothetical protein
VADPACGGVTDLAVTADVILTPSVEVKLTPSWVKKRQAAGMLTQEQVFVISWARDSIAGHL